MLLLLLIEVLAICSVISPVTSRSPLPPPSSSPSFFGTILPLPLLAMVVTERTFRGVRGELPKAQEVLQKKKKHTSSAFVWRAARASESGVAAATWPPQRTSPFAAPTPRPQLPFVESVQAGKRAAAAFSLFCRHQILLPCLLLIHHHFNAFQMDHHGNREKIGLPHWTGNLLHFRNTDTGQQQQQTNRRKL